MLISLHWVGGLVIYRILLSALGSLRIYWDLGLIVELGLWGLGPGLDNNLFPLVRTYSRNRSKICLGSGAQISNELW